MKLEVTENPKDNKICLASKESVLTKDVQIIILLFIISILELPVFFFLIKVFNKGQDNILLLYLLILGICIIVVFSLILFLSKDKLFYIKSEKNKKFLTLGWIKNLFFRRFEHIPINNIQFMKFVLVELNQKRDINFSLKLTNGKEISTVFEINNNIDQESLKNLLTDFATICGFTQNRFLQREHGFVVTYMKEKNMFSQNLETGKSNAISIPNLEILEMTRSRITIKRNINFYDRLRYLVVSALPIFLLFIGIFGNDPTRFLGIAISIVIYFIVLLCFFNYLLVPITIILDSEISLITVKKLFFRYVVNVSDVRAVIIKDYRPRRTGTFIFHVYLLLYNGKKKHFLFIEIPGERGKILETFENIFMLMNTIFKKYGIHIENECRFI